MVEHLSNLQKELHDEKKMPDEDFSPLLAESWDMFSLDPRLIQEPDNFPAL